MSFGLSFGVHGKPGNYTYTIEVYNLDTKTVDDARSFIIIVRESPSTTTTTAPPNTATASPDTNTTTTSFMDRIEDWWGGLTSEQKIMIGVGILIFLLIVFGAVIVINEGWLTAEQIGKYGLWALLALIALYLFAGHFTKSK